MFCGILGRVTYWLRSCYRVMQTERKKGPRFCFANGKYWLFVPVLIKVQGWEICTDWLPCYTITMSWPTIFCRVIYIYVTFLTCLLELLQYGMLYLPSQVFQDCDLRLIIFGIYGQRLKNICIRKNIHVGYPLSEKFVTLG